MRPVERGNIPVDANGQPVTLTDYRDARDYLINRLGDFCSYCEIPLTAPAVEHVQPKSLQPQLQNVWGNFLLACTYCNSAKGNKPINPNDYFWPDSDNSFRAYCYQNGLLPEADKQISNAQQQIALNSLALTGLDRRLDAKGRQDRRFVKRNEAWGRAERAKSHLANVPGLDMLEQVLDTALSTGFWSVWMTVFYGDVPVRQLLIEHFNGTCKPCFDADTTPLLRTGDKI